MNFLLSDAIDMLSKLELFLENNHDANLIVAPPLPYISALSDKYKNVDFASQDVSHNKDYGPYTGEVSARMVKSAGAKYAIIGHSDRRKNFNESNHLINDKLLNCKDAKITPILCVGESRESRLQGNYLEFIANQLNESFLKSNLIFDEHIIIAYEPIWAIGTKVTPTIQEIAEVADVIKTMINTSSVAKNVSIVYGGSVNSANYQDVLAIKSISGVLIGSASLDYKEIVQMIQGK